MEKKVSFLNVNKKRIILFVCMLFACLQLMVFIFSLSAMTLQESAKTSDGIINNLTEVVASQKGIEADELSEELSDFINVLVRKTGHFVLYALLGVITYFLSACVVLKDKKYLFPSLFSVPVCVVFAISDEIHQTFVKGRHGKVTDVVIDAVGTVVGTLVAAALIGLYRKLKKNIDSKKGKDNE